MNRPDAAHLVLVHDGRAYHHLGRALAPSTTVLADGQPITPGPTGWYETDSADTAFQTVSPDTTRTTAWELRDPAAASARYPARINALSDVADPDDDDAADLARSLYRPVSETVPGQRAPVDLPVIRLDGPPPPADGLTWQADLPYALAQRPEFAHLFPGKLLGYRKALTDAVSALPGVRHVFDHTLASGALEIVVEAPYDPPVPVTVPAPLAGGRTSRTRTVTTQTRLSRRLAVTAPDTISGQNRQAATAAWFADLDAVVADVTAASFVACGHCHGTGQTETPLHGRAAVAGRRR